jgi:hypothetical protein
MQLREVAKELENKLVFVHSPALRHRIIDVICPFVSRYFVPEYMWLVEQFFGDEGDSYSLFLSSTQGVAIQKIRDEIGSESFDATRLHSYAIFRYPVNSLPCNPEMVSVFDMTGREVLRDNDEYDDTWVRRAAQQTVQSL